MDFTNPLKMISGATDIAKTLLTAETVVEKAQLQLQMADVIGALASAKLSLLEAQEMVRKSEDEIARLHKAREEQTILVEGSGGFFWKSDGQGRRVGYPCCPSCLAKEARQVQLVRDGAMNRGRCPICQSHFQPVTYWTPKEAAGEPEPETPLALPTFAELGRDLA